jgi:hypothetical protein
MKQHFQDDDDGILTEKYFYILFDVIDKNGSLRRLRRQGLSFSNVARLTDIALEKGFIIVNEQKELALTETGLKMLVELRSKFKNSNKDEWIDFAKKAKIGKLDKNTIFVPNQNELTFRLK